MREAERHGEAVALSAYSLMEIAMLAQNTRNIAGATDRIFSELETNPMFRILPITIPIRRPCSTSRTTPADLRRRIIDSKLVSVVE